MVIIANKSKNVSYRF